MNKIVKCPNCGEKGKLDDFVFAFDFSQRVIFSGSKKAIDSIESEDDEISIYVDYGCLVWEFADETLDINILCQCPKCGHRFLLPKEKRIVIKSL
ncbi:MAG: hypothetical protein Q6363_002010 [Candidatus Njordarchaeota archaeon]